MPRHLVLALLVSLLSSASFGAAPCANITFDSAPTFKAGGLITGIATADFNGDGHPDLVVANGGSISAFGRTPGVKIYLNDGLGRFTNTITISDTLYADDVKVLDFDGDGAPDVLVTDSDTGWLLLFANRRTSFPLVWSDDETGRPPVVIGDFNGDHRADLARRIGVELVVYVAGNGTFTKLRLAEPVALSAGMAAGDLDGDGRDDLVEADPNGQQLYIRRGSATKVLDAPQPTAKFRENPYAVILGDFDGSGHLDIVTQAVNTTTVEVLHDPGVSSSAAPVWQPYDGYDVHIAADVTGDGVPDLVSHVPFGRVMVGVLGSNPTFQAQPRSYFALPETSLSFMAAADFDGDGKLDLAVSNRTDVAILFNRGGGRFIAPPHIGATGVRAVVDLNHDGIPDLIADRNPIVWFGNGDGTYRAGTAARPTPFGKVLVEIADVNGDGNLDMVVVANDPTGTLDGNLWILFGDGRGSFTMKDLGLFGKRPSSLAVTDIDRDGKLDIVVGNDRIAVGSTVTIAYGRGDGTFETPVDLAAPNGGTIMRVGDLDGDGLPDIVAGDVYARSLFFNLGGRKFRAIPLKEAIDDKLQVADMNGDGKADLIETTFFGVDVRVRLGRGDGTFLPDIVTRAPIYQASSLDVADLNGDGRPDVILNDYTSTASTNTFTVLLGKGNGQLEPPMSWLSWGALRIVDINGDGHPDIMNDDTVRLNICTDGGRRHVSRH